MGIQINGNTDNISATDGGLTVSDLELNQTGVSTFHSHLHVADQIIHLDDANSKIRFPAADTITAETAGTERLRIDNNGKILIATSTTSEAHANNDELIIGSSSDDANHGLTIVTPSSRYGTVAFSDGSGGNSQGLLEYNHSGDFFRIYTGGTGEKFRITSAGSVRIGGSTASALSAHSAADDLVVGGTSSHGITILTGDATGNIFFNNGSGNNGIIQYVHSTNPDSMIINSAGQIEFDTNGAERVRIDTGGSVSIGDAATHTFSAHSEGDDLVIGGAGWRGMTIYGEGGGGVIQFADNGDNRVGQIMYYHAENSMSFRVAGNVTRLKIDSNGDICVGNSGNPPWSETGGNYNNISLCGNDASSSGFLNLGNGAAATNADFDLTRIKIHNGATEVARITGTTATGDSGDANIKFFTKKAGSGLKEILRIRNDGFVETMYDQNTGSYSLSASPTPRLRIRNDYGGDGIISSAQFFAKRGSGAASIFDIGVITTSTDYESNLIISSRNTDATYSEKLRIESEGQLRMLYGNNAKQAYVLRSTFRTITGHSSTGFQYVRCALLGARTAYRVCINTTGGNYGPGAQFFTILRNWDSTTIYVSDKFNMGSAYANAVRMHSDNGGGNWYMEISIYLTTTSQGFGLSVIPIGNNAGSMTTNLQYYGSGMSNLANTSSAHSL